LDLKTSKLLGSPLGVSSFLTNLFAAKPAHYRAQGRAQRRGIP
jgi:hypothetical protein